MPRASHEEIFEFVRRQIVAGTPPTIRDVQRHFGFRSCASARQHLDLLVAEGRLVKVGGVARGYRLPDDPGNRPAAHVPIVGRVQAGPLSLAVEEIEGYAVVETSEPDELFALRVKGDSMREAGILDGDLVIVRRQDDADDGAIVAARVVDEATVKRLRKRGRFVELHPANPEFQPLRLAAEEVSLLGRVVEVRRQL
ncbi:MAG: repressor LexA [Myxococcales bacterium]|nr:MAG: repressor LexA [Myxococcales bacterium]